MARRTAFPERVNDTADLRVAAAVGLDQADRCELIDGPSSTARLRELLGKARTCCGHPRRDLPPTRTQRA